MSERQYVLRQQKVIEEEAELDKKILLLESFITTNPVFMDLPKEERVRLCKQLGFMESYSSILQERISSF